MDNSAHLVGMNGQSITPLKTRATKLIKMIRNCGDVCIFRLYFLFSKRLIHTHYARGVHMTERATGQESNQKAES